MRGVRGSVNRLGMKGRALVLRLHAAGFPVHVISLPKEMGGWRVRDGLLDSHLLKGLTGIVT